MGPLLFYFRPSISEGYSQKPNLISKMAASELRLISDLSAVSMLQCYVEKDLEV